MPSPTDVIADARHCSWRRWWTPLARRDAIAGMTKTTSLHQILTSVFGKNVSMIDASETGGQIVPHIKNIVGPGATGPSGKRKRSADEICLDGNSSDVDDVAEGTDADRKAFLGKFKSQTVKKIMSDLISRYVHVLIDSLLRERTHPFTG